MAKIPHQFQRYSINSGESGEKNKDFHLTKNLTPASVYCVSSLLGERREIQTILYLGNRREPHRSKYTYGKTFKTLVEFGLLDDLRNMRFLWRYTLAAYEDIRCLYRSWWMFIGAKRIRNIKT